MKNDDFEVIIVGGSYAGLSAAMSLGRSLRKVAIIDSGKPCNRQTPYSHNFLTQDGKTPAEIAATGKAQVANYDTVRFFEDFAVTGRKTENGFEIDTRSGKTFRCKKLIFATGITDIFPDIRGFAECWGISVIHCPYCHGYEHRGKKTGIFSNGDRAFHLATLVYNLSKDVTLFTNGPAGFSTEQIHTLYKHSIKIEETPLTEISHKDGHVSSLRLSNGDVVSLDALYAGIPFTQHSDIPRLLGCELSELGYIKVDSMQKTTIGGVFACGDNSTFMRSVAASVASGNLTGAMVNAELASGSFDVYF